MPEWLDDLLARLFGPAVKVGDFSRVRQKDELDGDEELLRDRNRAWLEMLREDPWMQKLLPHKKLLAVLGILAITMFVRLGLTERASHPIFSVLAIFNGLLIWYFFWIYTWERRTVQKIFEEFKKRFGIYFHLR